MQLVWTLVLFGLLQAAGGVVFERFVRNTNTGNIDNGPCGKVSSNGRMKREGSSVEHANPGNSNLHRSSRTRFARDDDDGFDSHDEYSHHSSHSEDSSSFDAHEEYSNYNYHSAESSVVPLPAQTTQPPPPPTAQTTLPPPPTVQTTLPPPPQESGNVNNGNIVNGAGGVVSGNGRFARAIN